MRRRPRGRWDRPELHRLLEQMRKGDILIVSRLDRLSGSLRDLLTFMEQTKEAEAAFVSLSEAIDTTTAPGRMMMQMVGAFAEFERAILRERTKTGLEAAPKEGRIGRRRPKLRPNQKDEIVAMVSAGTKTAADAARLFNVHPATVSRLLARAGARDYHGWRCDDYCIIWKQGNIANLDRGAHGKRPCQWQ
jgi:DNA invertase Pin-like site-specific DNA recombinase